LCWFSKKISGEEGRKGCASLSVKGREREEKMDRKMVANVWG